MSSIRNIKSSTPMPYDLAKKIGVGGVNEILCVFWQGYYKLKDDTSFVVDTSTAEDDITQKWYEKVVGIWDSRNRATSIALNGLRPIHQYSDNTMKKRKGSKSPTIDFCFKDWSTDNSYFGAEAKNLYESRPDKIARYVSTGVDNYTTGRYGSQSSESSIIGYVLSGKISEIANDLKTEMAKSGPIANLTRSKSSDPHYKSIHLRIFDGQEITLHHLFFDLVSA
ncbi:hypothetical protein [Congzhengia sp.]|uniref:hypothetical protein n=1 Tax=Congzhengia sp. TaxID=2944168 RepID=UPI0030788868